MDAKIIAIAVIAVVAIGGCAAFFVLNNNNDSKDSQYDLLDSTDNIKKGMKMELSGTIGDMKLETTHEVKSVSNGKVSYTETTKIIGAPMYDAYQLDSFSPESFEEMFGFDYTSDTIPQGVNVKHDGNNYTITGKYDTLYGMHYVYDLTITYDGTNVTMVSGSLESKTTSESGTITTTLHLGTSSGKLTITFDSVTTKDDGCDVKEFYTEGNFGYDPDDFKKCKITEKSGTFEGKSVTIYTITGETEEKEIYDGVNVYVYKGTILKQEGKVTMQKIEYNASVKLTITA